MHLPRLIEGRLVRRYKRFLADVELREGGVVIAHCPNPGSMKSMKEPGSEVWLSASDNPKRKLAYTWELVRSMGDLTLVHAGRANAIAEEALVNGCIEELRGFSSLRSEVPYGDRSRIDFCLDFATGPCFVEGKNVTMFDGEGRAAFPDSVTSRGTKHLRELMTMVGEGQRAVLLFCCSRANVTAIRPADEIDPVYGETLREAVAAGVEVLAYGCDVSIEDVVMRRAMPVMLAP
ncbi:MAG: DNA/RNA nuclease SfsA [Myxococcales bacterium]|nr:DNA/RNA nuclease SfsA [Myxococcales bacterium]